MSFSQTQTQTQTQAHPQSGSTWPRQIHNFNFDQAIRKQKLTLRQVFSQWPDLTCHILFEQGMTMADVVHHVTYGHRQGEDSLGLLIEHGLDYRMLCHYGQKRSFFGHVDAFDPLDVPFSRHQWRRLGVTHCDQIGMTVKEWNRLPAAHAWEESPVAAAAAPGTDSWRSSNADYDTRTANAYQGLSRSAHPSVGAGSGTSFSAAPVRPPDQPPSWSRFAAKGPMQSRPGPRNSFSAFSAHKW